MKTLQGLPAPLLRTLRQISRVVKLHAASCPPHRYRVRDFSILPKLLQVEVHWWRLRIEEVATLFQQDIDTFLYVLTHNTKTIHPTVIETIGQVILQYTQHIHQDVPFRLKRLHVWNVSGWTPTQVATDPKLCLVRRLVSLGPVLLQETRWHAESPQS